MITVKNGADCVIVLKAIGKPTLRLFPGQNSIDVKAAEDLKPYLGGNVAAKYHFENSLSMVKDNLVDKEEAMAAKVKNDSLNLKKIGG